MKEIEQDKQTTKYYYDTVIKLNKDIQDKESRN